MTEPPGTLPGFELRCELGRGTTGVVYDVQDTRLNRRVALMVPFLTPESERSMRTTRFMRAAEALASLTSKPQVGIPALHMVAEYQNKPFVIRELVDGATMEQLALAGSIDLRNGLSIIAQVARVVQMVHEQGFVHRNLSAANVLVGRDNTPWLIGFGRVGLVTGSQWLPPDATGRGTPAEVDVRGLQELVRWLCGAIRQPVPAGLERVIAPGAVLTAKALGATIAGYR